MTILRQQDIGMGATAVCLTFSLWAITEVVASPGMPATVVLISVLSALLVRSVTVEFVMS